jgi:hypothetical protein
MVEPNVAPVGHGRFDADVRERVEKREMKWPGLLGAVGAHRGFVFN